ncbi:MAG: alpha/beta hydrolase [Saprospiraceae bacterium]|nr:alpha/beta hydrolase [Saprospiraceae bacterium]
MQHLSRLLFFLTLTISATAQTTSIRPLEIGEVLTISSTVLQEDRTLNIYLPEAYDKNKAYPVLYLLDGTLDEDFLHIVGLVQFFNLMYTMPECIVVGIANVDRQRDYSFHTDLPELTEKYPTAGHSEAFIQFLETELQPYIEATYKTTDTKLLIGQSLGGLLATEILLKKPALFTHYLIVSPSLWWDNESLLKDAPKWLEKQFPPNLYVYFSAGKKEPRIMRRVAKKIAKLVQQAKKPGMRLILKMMPEEDHATILHRSIYSAFLSLYPPRY